MVAPPSLHHSMDESAVITMTVLCRCQHGNGYQFEEKDEILTTTASTRSILPYESTTQLLTRHCSASPRMGEPAPYRVFVH